MCLSNNPEESMAYLRDFGTRFPDSLYDHDATIANAKALLALNQPSRSHPRAGGAPHSGERRDRILSWARLTCRVARQRRGAEILQRVYYEYATNYLADAGLRRLAKDSR